MWIIMYSFHVFLVYNHHIAVLYHIIILLNSELNTAEQNTLRKKSAKCILRVCII